MLTRLTGTGSGTAPVVNLTFPFIDKTHVLATVNGSPAAFTWTGAAQITFGATVGAAVPWAVYRKTPTDPLVDFTDGSVLTEADLDLAHRQHQYLDEEAQDNIALLGTGISYTDENARDAVGAALVAGANIGIAVNDPGDTITVSASMDQEVIRDTIAAALRSGPNVTITVDDPGDTITIAAAGGGGGGGLSDGTYGDITVSGTGTVMTIGAAKVTLAKMANLAANSILGNNTGAGATPIALTGAQVTAMLSAVVGDSGAGGTKGLVPAPGAGDAAAGKFLNAAGGWSVPSAGGTTTNALTFNNGGSGAVSGTTFNGSTARTISYNSIGASPAYSPQSSFSADHTVADADNDSYQKFTGSTPRTLTLDGTPGAGLSMTVVNRSSAVLSLAAASGVYKNGAAATATTGSLAVGGKIVLFHEGSGVWTADGSGLS